MGKNNRSGKAALLTDSDYARIRKYLVERPSHLLIFDIARYSGERWGAILQLKVSDVYGDNGTPRGEITFRAITRKASPDGLKATRQVPVHPNLRNSLLLHKIVPGQVWLFPSPKSDRPLLLRSADLILRDAVSKAGLTPKGISSHSTRRTFISKLHASGVDLRTIQQITGHANLRALGQYIEVDVERVKNAIALL